MTNGLLLATAMLGLALAYLLGITGTRSGRARWAYPAAFIASLLSCLALAVHIALRAGDGSGPEATEAMLAVAALLLFGTAGLWIVARRP